MKTAIIVVLSVVIVALLVLPRIGAPKGGAMGDPVSAPSSTSQPADTESESVQGVGYVEPITEVRRLVFRASGVIDECKVEVGQVVHKNDVLMALNHADLLAEIDSAKADLAVSEAERSKVLSGAHPQEIAAAEQRIAIEQAQVTLADKKMARYTQMLEHNASSQGELDDIVAEKSVAEASKQANEADLARLMALVRPEDSALAEAKVHQAEAHVADLQCQEQDAILRAPIDGTVLEILKRPGESAGFYEHEPVIIFGDVSQLRVRAEIDERSVSSLRVGQKARISGRGLGNATYAGAVTEIRQIMGKKTVFARTATERKDLDVVQVIVNPSEPFHAPVGLEVDVDLDVSNPADSAK
jgi:HlyD family secretion protein